MPSADHSRQALLRQADWLASVSSPRVRTNSFPSCTFGLYIAVSVWLLGFNLFGSLTRQHMPETVSVRKVNGLPRASFSRNLAVQALPLAMCLAPPPAFRDFHPIEFAHAERTNKKATRRSLVGQGAGSNAGLNFLLHSLGSLCSLFTCNTAEDHNVSVGVAA